jgi:signal transduction histidine kinase
VVSPEGVARAVEDGGLGFGVGNCEVGRVGMRPIKEHAALLGGVVRLSSWPDAGTEVEVSVPLTEEDVR